jgi:hypothetical protein
LSQKALSDFSDAHCDQRALLSSPGPVVLYACGERRVSAIPDEFEVARADSRYFQFVVQVSGADPSGYPFRLYEHVQIGRGVPVSARAEAVQVILEDLPI